MGMETSHVCRSCGARFTVQWSGSRKSDVLHCDVCGARTYVLFADVQDLRVRYDPGPFLSEAVETEPVKPGETHPDALFCQSTSFGLLIQAGPGSCGGSGRLLTKRSGCAA